MAIKRIGLLGGSFDPVHLTHIALAEAAYNALNLDTVEIIPAGKPWQRGTLAASSAHRLAMLKIATHNYPWITINSSELERDGPTYTIDTLRQLASGPEYYWILGSDQLQNFCTWHRWADIIRRVHLAVASRPEASITPPQPLLELLSRLGRSLITLPLVPNTMSATSIRQRLSEGKPTAGLLDVAVTQYIQHNGLYQARVV